MSFGRAGRVQRAPPPPPAPLTPADIREYAPPEFKVYEGTPFAVNFLVDGSAGNGFSGTKMSPSSVRVVDTAFTRLVTPLVIRLESGFDLNKFIADADGNFKEKYPGVKITIPPGFMMNPANVNQFAERLTPLRHTLDLIEQEERYKRAKEGKALAAREGELAGLFGGKRRRKTRRSAPKKTGKKHVVRRRRGTRKH